MSNYAVIDSKGVIVNMVILEDEGNGWEPDNGLTSVKADDSWVIGGAVINGEYTAPEPEKPSDEELVSLNVQTKSSLMEQALDKISALQYAVDLDMATNDEKTTLTAWKKYIVLLNRVDANVTADINWPDTPS